MILPRVVTRLCVRGPGGDHQAVQGVALRLLLHGTPGELGLVDSWALSSDWWTHTVLISDWSGPRGLRAAHPLHLLHPAAAHHLPHHLHHHQRN